MTILGTIGVRGSLFDLATKGEITVNSNKAIQNGSIFHTLVKTPKEQTQEEPKEMVIPENLAKTDNQVVRENNIHKKKLLEICEGYGEDEVRIACAVFARNYPDIMYDALREEHQNMKELVNGVSNLSNSFLRKFDGEK